LLDEIVPASIQSKGAESVLLKIPLHFARCDAVVLGRVKLLLDCGYVTDRRIFCALLACPVFDHHEDGCGAATIVGLGNKRNINPDGARRLCAERRGEKEERQGA
jgi:hypothetical protein